MGTDWDGLKSHPYNTQSACPLQCPGMRGTGLPGCARARASTWANPPVRCRDGNNHWDDYMTDKYKYRGQIRGRVCGGPEGGVRQIHVCQRGHLRRPVEGGTETWTGDVHLEGEERKVGHTHSNNDLLLMSILFHSLLSALHILCESFLSIKGIAINNTWIC